MVKRLTIKETEFVRFFARFGDPVLAAKEAGYSHPGQTGSMVAARPHVAAATAAARQYLAVEGVPIAIKALIEVAQDGKSESARVSASRTILEFSGMGAAGDASTKEPHEMNADELAAAIERLEAEAADRARQIQPPNDDIFG